MFPRSVGAKSYELTDHLGNVKAVVSDRKKLSDEVREYRYSYGFENSGDVPSEAWSGWSFSTEHVYRGSQSVKVTGFGHLFRMAVEPGDTVSAEAMMKFVSGTTGSHIYLAFQDENGQNEVGVGSEQRDLPSHQHVNEWFRIVHPPTVVPAGKYSVLVYLRKRSEHSEAWFDDFKISVKRGYAEPVLSAEVLSANSYYAFGSLMPKRSFNSSGYRYGFNGKERDSEGMGGGGSTYDYGFRIYNPQLGKFLSVDPLAHKFAFYTPYQFAGNKPIVALDLDGREDIWIHEITNLDTKIKTTTIKEVNENVKKEIIAFLGYDPDAYKEGGSLMTSALTENGETYRVSDNYVKPVVVTGTVRGDGAIIETLKSWDRSLEGEDGLKNYSSGLNNTGNALKAASLFSGPAAPALAGLGEGLGVTSDIINTALDFKNKDLLDASINAGIRLISFGVGKYFDKSIESAQIQLPKNIGDETMGENMIKLGIDLGLDKLKDSLTED